MTVCIAAIYDNENIAAVADKRLTINTGVTSTYEINENKKIVKLTDSCIALFAGNVANASEVLKKVIPKIDDGDSVEMIAKKLIEVSIDCYNFIIESQLLSKYGLTLKTFSEQQKDLDPTFVTTTIQTIDQNNLGIEILVVGKDGDTPQLLKIGLNNALSDESSIGYAYIGSGSGHANSSLIESECHPTVTMDTALHAIVRAKRKAEYDPHVGEKSDIVILSESVDFIDDSNVKKIFQTYDKSQIEVDSIHVKCSKEIGGIINGDSTK